LTGGRPFVAVSSPSPYLLSTLPLSSVQASTVPVGLLVEAALVQAFAYMDIMHSYSGIHESIMFQKSCCDRAHYWLLRADHEEHCSTLVVLAFNLCQIAFQSSGIVFCWHGYQGDKITGLEDLRYGAYLVDATPWPTLWCGVVMAETKSNSMVRYLHDLLHI
jgi:hypothetical protein